MKIKKAPRVLAVPEANYQLKLYLATGFLSTGVQERLQRILCRAIDDAYARGKKDREVNGS